MISLYESVGPDWDRTRDPWSWIYTQIRISSQTGYRLRYASRYIYGVVLYPGYKCFLYLKITNNLLF